MTILFRTSVALPLLLGTTTAFLNSHGMSWMRKTGVLPTQATTKSARCHVSNFETSLSTTKTSLLQSSDDDAAGSSQPDNTHDGDEADEAWIPTHSAKTTPQMLAAVWSLIADGSTMVRGETSNILFPEMEDQISSPSYVNRLMGHLDACKDICDSFGTQSVLVPFVQEGKVKGFTLKSYRNPDKDPDSYEFEYDPFWDDGDDWNHEGVDEAEEGGTLRDPYPEIANRIPDDDDELIRVTKMWVDKMMSDMGICPFTSGPDLAGLPMGNVFYKVDRCSQIEEMYASYWKEVVRLEQNSEKDISTALLIAPEFLIDNIELFESFSNTLTQPLAALGVEDLLQLVFFHPQWTFRDGAARSGLGSAANYARRSPWPMINLLRTKQVRAAQKGIPTGLVYKQNEKTLDAVGTDKLETMLRLRNWSEISDVKVDRKDMEALRVAQDFQQTGVLKEEDMKFEYDATPAANKVDRSQIEGGNLMNVVKQALEKRLGTETGEMVQLSGPETSATIMATDFLLEELDRIAGSRSEASEAQRLLMEDVKAGEQSDAESDALFGNGGVVEGDDSSFS